ncbi:MAG: DNA translocase FtsK, partial [Treponema sp.]|nr:DNA translocase FtsK [Treponema sp.]
MITQEEFAALTSPEEPADELEWPDLPPQPEKLPPEYDEDFDENDPALEFPPKELPKEEKVEKEEYNSNDPYAAARYVDSVVENPRFPHGIVIHDYNEQTEEEDDKESDPKEEKKSKFPSKISLYEDAVSTSSPEPEFDDEDDYVEDETLPMPDFDIEKPAISQIEEAQSSLDKEIEFYAEDDEDEEDTPSEENLQNFFDQVDPSSTVQAIEDPYEAEKEETPEDNETEVESPVFNQIAQTEMESEGSLSDAASDVFSDMEADIRKNQPPRPVKKVQLQEEVATDTDEESQIEEQESNQQTNIEDNIDDDEDEMELPAQKTLQKSNNPLSSSATNLTADELTDFFHAQQEENKPKGTEIMANPPKLDHRATKKGPYVIPSDLLTAYKDDEYWVIDEATKQAALNLKQTLGEFNIEAEIIGIKKGPVVTMFELLPAPGVKLSKIVALQDNIALSLAAQSVRIVAPIPGKQAVGIEVPNRHRSVVGFREIIEMDLPEWKKMSVPVILGKDILGKAQLIDLVKTPHMLIAGATGSGKSVCVNSLILSILYKRSYQDVKMILVDPKVVELKLYNNIPHLLTPVITEPKKALQALKWALCEMERRYALLDQMGVRDISNYNQKIKDQKICTEKLPYIVIIIDEFADLMATSGKELESVIARLTAMSRAVGIHLVLATQRPSVNVITGLIKANIPTRIAFMVASRTDSNIIIDSVGAEKLLGRGDMLYASAVDPAPVRIQGTFVSDQEVEDVVRAVKEYG